MDNAVSPREAIAELLEGEHRVDALFSRLGMRCYHATIIFGDELYAASFSHDVLPGVFRIGLGRAPMEDDDYAELMVADPSRPIFYASDKLDFRDSCAVARLGSLGFKPISAEDMTCLDVLVMLKTNRDNVTSLKM
ncbi:MAG: hypothetical protein FJY76_01780 [Candidatus Aenigmarchaeota archaeon]|nr:hypothetical protein [Candidatus Aenigmarchaeota archaeon]